MKQILIASFIVLMTFVGSKALCPPFYRSGIMNICKDANKQNCVAISNSNSCFNLNVPYVSGFAGGNYNCQVYEKVGCGGNFVSVNAQGWSRFPWLAMGFRCPCIR